jgi:hypothetical protein
LRQPTGQPDPDDEDLRGLAVGLIALEVAGCTIATLFFG